MGHMEDSLNQHSNQQDQPDSSSEITMFTLIPPDGQSGLNTSSQVVMKNDSNNNSNDRNNNNGKNKLNKGANASADDGNNNHHKRQGLITNGLQRYQIENCNTESNANTSSSLHPHHLLLLQQQQMGQNHMLLEKQSNNIIPGTDSPSLIVLQPSGQPGSPYAPFPYYAAGKYRILHLRHYMGHKFMDCALWSIDKIMVVEISQNFQFWCFLGNRLI